MNDKTLIKSASDRAVARARRGRGRINRPSINEVECPWCGRYWCVTPTNGVSSVGFIISAAENHAFICHIATPEERRAMARVAEKGWLQRPPANTIKNDLSHQGFVDTRSRKEPKP